MGCVEAVKPFFLKKSFDFDRPDISLYNFHPQIRILLALKGIFFSNRNTYIRLILPVYWVLLSSLGMAFQVIFVCRGLYTKDYSLATECFCYFIIISTTPLVYTNLLYNRDKTVELFNHMNEEFKSICSLSQRYRTPFLQGQLLIWKLCYAWMIFSVFTGAMFMIFPGFSVADACFYCGWQNNSMGKLLRLDLMIIIMRAQKPLLIKFSGLSNIELETFSSVMSAAYSYFNMLRNSN